MIYTVSNGKKLSFSRCYIHCMMNKFGNNFLVSVNMQNWSSPIVFDTGVRNNEYSVLINK